MKWKLQKYRRPVLFAKSLIILKEKNCKNVVDYLPIQPLCFGKNAPRWNEISSLNNAAPSSAFPLFEHLLVFFATLSFSRERHLLCRPLGPQNNLLKRKKVKLLLPSPISILSSNDVRIFQSLASLCHILVFKDTDMFSDLDFWLFLWSFLRLIYSEGPIRWGEGRPSSAGKILVDKIKTSWFLRVFLLKNCLSRNFKVIIDDFQAQGNKTRIPAGDEVRPNNWKIQNQISISIFERSGSK